MRQISTLSILIGGSILLAACSKKPEPAAGDNDTAATTETASAEDPSIIFDLSGGKNTAASPTTQAPDTSLRQPSTERPEMEPAQLISRVIPFYPLSLRMQGIEGRVDVRLVINTEGLVERAEAIGSTEPRFTDFALEAIRMSRFSPARQNGVPQAIVTDTSIVFASEFGSLQMPQSSPLARMAYQDGTFYEMNESGRLAPAEFNQPIPLLQLIPPTPASARAGETLQAKVKFTVTEEGQVINPSVSGATNAELSRAITEVMPFWQYIPRMRNGKPTSTNVELPFKIDNRSAGK